MLADRRSRRLGMVLVAVVALATLPVAHGANAAPAQTGGAGLLRLVDQTTVVAPGGEFVVRLQVSGAPVSARLAVTVHDAVTTRSGFARSIEGEGLRRRLRTIGPAELSTFTPDAAGMVTIRLPLGTAANQVRAASGGAYPVVIELFDGDGGSLARLITHLVRLPEATDEPNPPLLVALVAPSGGEPSRQPDDSVVVSSGIREGSVALASALLERPDVPLTLVPTPETVDGLAASPDPGDRSILASLEQAASGRQVLAAPYVRLDLPAWVDAGLDAELEAQFDRGASTVAELLARPDGRTWLASSGIDPPSASFLRRRGVDQLVVPQIALAPLDEDDFPTTLTRPFLLDGQTGIRAVMADQALSAHAGSTGDPVLDAHRLLADLAVLYFDRPPLERGVVVALPDSWQPSAAFLDVLIDGLATTPVLRPVTVDTLLAQVPVAGESGIDDTDEPLQRVLTPVPASSLGRLPAMLEAARARPATYRSVVGRQSPRTDPFDVRILTAGARGLSTEEQASYLEPITNTVRGELAKVSVPERQSITLTARKGRLPLTFHNTAGYPMTVSVELQSDALDFPKHPDRRLDVLLDEETKRVELDVVSRASGSSPLYVVVQTPDRRVELARTRYTVRSTAFSGVGLVLSIGAGVFLVLWWGRSIRRTLHARRAST